MDWKLGGIKSRGKYCVNGETANDLGSGAATTTDSSGKGLCSDIPTRHVITTLGFFGFLLFSSFRLNLSLTIVAMVNATAVYGHSTRNDTHSKEGEFIWTPKMQGIILGAFYYPTCIAILIGGRLCDVYGPKKVFGLGMLGNSIFTLLTPISARYHTSMIIAVRSLAGFIQGLILPAVTPLVRKWAPPKERSLMVSVVYCGLHFGSFVTVLVAGYLCDSDFLGGWPSVYYLSGLLGCVWCLFWAFFVFDSPSQHPRISDHELHHILSRQGGLSSIQHPNDQPPVKRFPVPWKSILLSVPVWAVICAAFAVRWAQYHFYTVHPTYMATVLKFPIKENGLLSSIPHLVIAVTVVLGGYVSDWIRKKRFFSMTTNHKIFLSVGMLGYLLCIVGVLLAGYDKTINTVLLIVSLGFNGIGYVTYTVAPVDMSSHFAGTLTGVMGFFSTMPGFIIPNLVGAITDEEQTMAQWKIIFYISMSVVAMTTMVFVVFGSTELQPWDSVPEEKKNGKELEIKK